MGHIWCNIGVHARRSNNALSIKWYCTSYEGRNYRNVNVRRGRKQSGRRILDLTSQISAGIWSSDSTYSLMSDSREWENERYCCYRNSSECDFWCIYITGILRCIDVLVVTFVLHSYDTLPWYLGVCFSEYCEHWKQCVQEFGAKY